MVRPPALNVTSFCALAAQGHPVDAAKTSVQQRTDRNFCIFILIIKKMVYEVTGISFSYASNFPSFIFRTRSATSK